MLTPSMEEFRALAGRGGLVPMYREVVADLETPVSAFARFAEEEHAFLLESVEGGERWGRYSLIGLSPWGVFTIESGEPCLYREGARERLSCPPEGALAALTSMLAAERPAVVPGLPRFFGGAVGYLGYEAAGLFERLPAPKPGGDWPEACFMLTDRLILFDNVRHTLKALVCVRPGKYPSVEAAYHAGAEQVEDLLDRLRMPRPVDAVAVRGEVTLEAETSRREFEGMVAKARQYIINGDVVQAVLSQRFSGKLPVSPLAIYRALRVVNPSPYLFFLKMGSRCLVGSSPEVMARRTGSRIEVRPIAGTRPRGANEQEDRALADDLLSDEKERAEHLMLVDLGRNDLGRVAVPGSVQVRDFMTVERYSHVMHLVSHVEAQLRRGLGALDVIRATFPAGTLTGAPKVRAMQIIHELEQVPRGPYGGALGYLGYDGNMDLAITIRTLTLDGDRICVQAGAGIVYDSDPAREWEEVCNKAQGMIGALHLAAAGLETSAGLTERSHGA